VLIPITNVRSKSLGASQAIGVALACALAELFGFSISPMEAAQIAHYVERSFEGIPVGFGSFLAAAVVRRGHVLLIDSHRLDWSHIDVDFDRTLVMGINTHAPSAVTQSEEAARQGDCVH